MKRQGSMSTPQPTPSSSSSSNRAPPLRKPSGAFLRKPIPAAIPDSAHVTATHHHHEVDHNPPLSDDTSEHAAQKRRSVRSSLPSSSQSYSSVPRDDNDDHDHPVGPTAPNSSSSSSNNHHTLERHLTLFDLVAIGVGGTIGSGLFVLAGLVAHDYAGPAAVLSWLVSGMAALLSGCCYAELASRIPIAGSTYAYSYVAMGELPAVIAAACLSLEYIAAAAAVARSWGDKVVEWLTEDLHDSHWVHDYLFVDQAFNPLALTISLGTVLLLLHGVKESKRATNFITALKVSLVTFMVLVGLWHCRPSNWIPFFPMGVSGVFRGATGTFFGYLGYDQVCCLAEEVQDAKRNLPRAILWVLTGVTVLYMTATLALTGMQPYADISPVSGFPSAFRDLGAMLASQITALGEILTLPIVILTCLMAQPRLMYGMAVDGLLPPMFQQVDAKGTLVNGTIVAGAIMTLVAAFIPFAKLNDMISGAVLLALNMTDSSVILLWHMDEEEESSPSSSPDTNASVSSSSSSSLANRLVLCFHIASLVASISLSRFSDNSIGLVLGVVALALDIFVCFALWKWCPRAKVFGGQHRYHYHQDEIKIVDEGYFECPFVPALPCVAILVNWYLIAQLDFLGVAFLLGFLLLATVYYFAYAAKHSVGNTTGWEVHEASSDEHNSDAGIELPGKSLM